MNILELKKVNLIKNNGEILLENVNLEVSPGEVILITGTNGIGKSTLFKALKSFEGYSEENYAIIDGEYIFDGDNSEKKENLCCKIIDIHQIEFYQEMRNFKETLMVAIPQCIEKNKREQYLENWIETYKPFTKTEEDKYKSCADNEFIATLKSFFSKEEVKGRSGGEEKYLSILEGLVRCDDPEIKLVLIDEPTNNLDHSHIKHLSDLIQRIRHFRHELAFIIISHCHVWPYITKTYEISNKKLIEVETECHNCFGRADKDGYYNSSMNPSK